VFDSNDVVEMIRKLVVDEKVVEVGASVEDEGTNDELVVEVTSVANVVASVKFPRDSVVLRGGKTV
jgi:hypothetical protein